MWASATHLFRSTDPDLEIKNGHYIICGDNVTDVLHSPEIDGVVPIVAGFGDVRDVVNAYQHSLLKPPGTIADGRDECKVFETKYRFFFTADPEVCAKRIYQRARNLGRTDVTFEHLLEKMKWRNEQDANRKESPFQPHPLAKVIDTTSISAEEAANEIICHYRRQKGVCQSD